MSQGSQNLFRGRVGMSTAADFQFPGTKGLRYSDDFCTLLALLKEKISDYRDYEIAHAKNPRAIHATTWNADGVVRMMKTNLYPRSNEMQKETESVSELLARIDSYIDHIMALVVNNRAKSRHLRVHMSVGERPRDTHGSR